MPGRDRFTTSKEASHPPNSDGQRDQGDNVHTQPNSMSDSEASPPVTFGRRLRRARLAKRWSQLQLVHRMREVSSEHRGTATIASLMIMLSKWENDRKRPNQYNLHLLAASLDLPVAALGLPVDPDFAF